MRTCKGCGIGIQKDDPQKPGFVPEKIFDQAEVCQRCYRLVHYGDLKPSLLDKDSYKQAVKEALDRADTVFLVLDIIDFESSLQPEFDKLLRKKHIIGVVTKIDLLPPITSAKEALAWAKKRLPYPDNFVAVSGKKGWGIDELSKLRGQVTAVVGTTNSGKSTLVNKLVNEATPTVSVAFGTTLNNLFFTDSKGVIIDTPGLWPQGRLLELLCLDCASSLVPDKKMVSKLFELKEGQGITLGGLVYLNLRSEKPILAIAFVPESIEVNRVNKDKAKSYLEHYAKVKSPPCSLCQKSLTFEKKDVRIGNEDLVIPGLGWVSFRHTPAALEVIAPAGLSLTKRAPLIGPKNKVNKRPSL